MTEFYSDRWVTIHAGDCREVMAAMEPESVQTVVTSPPYFGLRDYGIPPTVWGGEDHEHAWSATLQSAKDAYGEGAKRRWQHDKGTGEATREATADDRVTSLPQGSFCECGAWLGVLGLEPSLDLYVAHMVEVFRLVRRVLRKDGLVFLNLGDSYNAYNGGSGPGSTIDGPHLARNTQRPKLATGYGLQVKSLKPKDRLGIPHRVVFALQEDGWIWRDEIVWHKPNSMPSSVEDRTTPAHEMVFMLTMSGRPRCWRHRDGRWVRTKPDPDYVWRPREGPGESTVPIEGWRRVNLWSGFDYFYDAPAIAEPGTYLGPNGAQRSPYGQRFTRRSPAEERQRRTDKQAETAGVSSASSARQYAGFNDRWDAAERSRRNTFARNGDVAGHVLPGQAAAQHRADRTDTTPLLTRNKRSVWTVATAPYPDTHFATFPPKLIEPMILAGSRPGDVVLDPFGGTGTVGMVSRTLGRRSVLIDLNPEYLRQMLTRTTVEWEHARSITDDGSAEHPEDSLWAIAP